MCAAFAPSLPLTNKYSSFSGSSLTTTHEKPCYLTTSSSKRAFTTVQAIAADASKMDKVSESVSKNVMDTYARYSLSISHGKGSHLFDTDGKRYLDCVAGIATCTLGHAHPAVVDAVSRQIARTAHVSNLYYIPEQAKLAEWLVEHSPADKVFFCNSGAEANEAAIKLARKHWSLKQPDASSSKKKIPVIITAEQSFHGRTLATLTATGQPKYHQHWGPLVDGFQYVRYNDLDHLSELCETLGDSLAAILLEPIQGEGGVRPATDAFLQHARALCDRVDALLMFDEVQVGMGRTGSVWAFEQNGVVPDVFTLAKGLGGGVPIGAMLAQNHCDVFAPGDHASTFGGNPLATAAGMVVAQHLIGEGIVQNVAKRGVELDEGLCAIQNRIGGSIDEVRGKGLIKGVQLANGLKAANVVAHAMRLGLLLVPAGPNVVRLVPPLVITEAEVVEVLRIFEKALEQAVAESKA